jgi:hypothetical protein
MIFDAIIYGVTDLLTTVFSVFPSLPQMPTAIVDGSSFIITTVGNSAAFLSVLYGNELYVAILFAVVALFNFEHLYHFTQYIYKLIRR